jgi:hypothetical protein
MKNKNSRVIITAIALCLLFSSSAISQGFIVPDLDGFKKETNYPVYTPDDLWDYINGGADSYNALGFKDLHIFEYSRGKKNQIKLEIYRHRSEEMAFGIYALERAPSYNFISRGVQGYSGEGFQNFFKGVYYIKIYTYSKNKKALEGVDKLASEVDQAIDAKKTFPEELGLLPAEGRKVNEEMFVSENVIGHSFLSDAYRASYDVDGKSFIIYLFVRESAEDIASMVQKYMARQDLDVENQSEGKAKFEDGYNGDIFFAWKNRLMVLITGLDSTDSDLAFNYISNILN